MNLKEYLQGSVKNGQMKPVKSYLIPRTNHFEVMKNAKNVIDKVTAEVKDIFSTDFDFPHTGNVPNVDDAGLTYANGETKKGKEITTCVLFVDIRNSVALNNETYTKTMGRIYTAFTKSVLRAAAQCGGYVRNIIGDRVMVVFPEDNCFQNAVDCAITINHIAKYVINPQTQNHNFSCGIGIDYGKMRCIKVGAEKHGTENTDNKNLVWIGRPANMASRLCDNANKEVQLFEVVHKVYEPQFTNPYQTILNANYVWKNKTEILTAEQLMRIVTREDFSNISSIAKKGGLVKRKPILISASVYDGFKKKCPNYNSIKNGLWHKDTKAIRDVTFDVYGADLYWKLN